MLNRLAQANLQGIAGDVAALMPQGGRRQVGDAVTDELLQVRPASWMYMAISCPACSGLMTCGPAPHADWRA